jgi:N,N'-diacetylchitobiose transport system permease protein
MATAGGTARRTDRAVPYLLVLPSLLLIAGVLGYPLARLLILSFQNYKLPELLGNRPVTWVGLDNYTKVLGDPFFWTVVVRSIVFTAVCVGLTMGLGLAMALLLRWLGPKMRLALNAVLVLVWSMPALVAIAVWQWMVDYEFGVLNWLLSRLGLPFDNHNWFENPLQGFAVIAALVVWGAIPFVAISLYAGLTQVPRELEDAARVDGASRLQVLRAVTLPFLRPLLVILTSLSVIWDFTVFQQVWVMLDGRPGRDYYLIGVYSFVESFGANNYGSGAAIAVVMVLLLLVVTGFYIRQMLRIGEEDSR